MNLFNYEEPPVTVDVVGQIKPGCEAEFELRYRLYPEGHRHYVWLH
jgi:hypothetical protein